MQIILASAKIMNDRSATKGDACQSKNQWLELVVDGSFHHPVYRLDGIPMLYGQTLITFIMDKSNISYSRNKQ